MACILEKKIQINEYNQKSQQLYFFFARVVHILLKKTFLLSDEYDSHMEQNEKKHKIYR